MTSDSAVVSLRKPETLEDPLTTILRSGARQLLAQAIEAEIETFLATMKDQRLADGREGLGRHGFGAGRARAPGAARVRAGAGDPDRDWPSCGATGEAT